MSVDISHRMSEFETVQLNRHDNRSLFARPPRQKFTALEVSLTYVPAPPHIPPPPLPTHRYRDRFVCFFNIFC